MDDYNRCKEIHWSVNKYTRTSTQEKVFYYASNSKVGLLHRFLIYAEKGRVVDHIDGDTLDNRKCNLQQCKAKENIRKQRKRVTNKSGYTGVCWNKHIPTPKWVAYIKVDYRRKHLGYFDNIEDAINARHEAELKYYGKYLPIEGRR